MEQETDWTNKIYKEVLLKSPNGMKKIICYSRNGIHFLEPFSNEQFLLISHENMKDLLRKETFSFGNVEYELNNLFTTRGCVLKNVDIKKFYQYICNTQRGESIIKFLNQEKEIRLDPEKQKIRRYSDKINQVLNNRGQ